MRKITLKNMIKKLLVACSVIVMFFAVMPLSGCAALSNEEHVERISARVQERFIDRANYPYTDFTVTILYDKFEEPVYFMVEFMPDGFFYGIIYRNDYFYMGATFFGGSYKNSGWENEETDDTTIYYRSHFYIAGIESERKYLIFITTISGHIVVGTRQLVRRNGLLVCIGSERIIEVVGSPRRRMTRGFRNNLRQL